MHTPNIERIAAKGVVFERAYVQVALVGKPFCSSARVALGVPWRRCRRLVGTLGVGKRTRLVAEAASTVSGVTTTGPGERTHKIV